MKKQARRLASQHKRRKAALAQAVGGTSVKDWMIKSIILVGMVAGVLLEQYLERRWAIALSLTTNVLWLFHG